MPKRIDDTVLDEGVRLVYEEEISFTEASRRIGVDRRTLYRYYAARNLPAVRRRPIPQEVYEQAEGLIQKGWSIDEAADFVRIHRTTLTRWRRANNKGMVPNPNRAHTAPITAKIRSILLDGKPHRVNDVYAKVADVIGPGQAMRAAERERKNQLRIDPNRPRTRNTPIEAQIEFGKRALFRMHKRNDSWIRWRDEDGEEWMQLRPVKPSAPPHAGNLERQK